MELYKSLRTVIFEVQTASGHKPGETWKTASGKWGAKNKAGQTDYFEDEDSAKAWISGNYAPAGRTDKPGDTSTPVELDADGNEKTPPSKTGGVPSGKPEPAAAQKPQAAPTKAERSPQPKDSGQGKPKPKAQVSGEDEEHAEVARENPKTELDSAFVEDPKATEKARAKPDIRRANTVARAIKSGELDGPQDDRDSVFGDAEAERRFVEEMNHAALSAMRGEKAYDFELCSEVFAHLGLCFDPKTKEKVSKGIARKDMPQFSSQVDPKNPDSPAFRKLMAKKGYTSPDQVKPEDLKDEINMEEEYRKALEAAGYEIKDEDTNVTSLKPIQGELKGEKVAAMYGSLAAAQADPQNYGKAAERLLEPIYVSDGYVIDGHHRWAAQCAIDIANGAGANAKMRTRTITKNGKPVPIDEIIEFSNKFQREIGLMSQTRGGETVKEKPKTQKEWSMSKFGASRMGRLVESINESVAQRLHERVTGLGRPKRGKSKSSEIVHDPDSKFRGAMAPLAGYKNPRVPKPTKTGDTKTSVSQNIYTAQDLIDTALSKPSGTTVEFFGVKGGKEFSIKLKVAVKNGVSVLVTSAGKPVRLEAGSQGLRVVEDNPFAKTPRVLMDNGKDMIWESADLTDVGMMQLNELRKLSDAELAKLDAQRRQKVMAKKDAEIQRRAREAKQSWSKSK